MLGYFKPTKKQFGELVYKEEHMKFANLGCQLFENLLSTESGCTYLSSCGFLNELYDLLQTELKVCVVTIL